MRLQQVVHSARQHWPAVDGKRLLHLLGREVEPAKHLAHQNAHDVLRHEALRAAEHLRQCRVAIGGENGKERFERARVAARALARLVEQFGGRGLETELPVHVHFPQDVLGERRRQPFVQLDTGLAPGLLDQEIARGDPRGDDERDRVRRRVQQRYDGVGELRVAHRQALRIDDVLEVVEQHEHAPALELLEQRLDLGGRRLYRVRIGSHQLLCPSGRQQPAEVGVEVRHCDAPRTGRAQVDDGVSGRGRRLFERLPGVS